MKFREFTRLLSPTYWLVVLVVVALIIAGGWWMVTEPGRANQRTAEAKTAGAMSDARAGSAAQAGNILDQAHVNATTSEALSRENADAIAQAPGAGQRLDPGLNRAGRERVCLRPAYRLSAECVQLLGRPQSAG